MITNTAATKLPATVPTPTSLVDSVRSGSSGCVRVSRERERERERCDFTAGQINCRLYYEWVRVTISKRGHEPTQEVVHIATCTCFNYNYLLYQV